MASRVYLGQSPQLHGNVAFNGGWEKTTGAIRRMATTDKFSTAMATTTIAANGTNANDTLLGQWISLPLSGAQTITGNVKGQARMFESAAGLDARVQVVIYVIQSDLTTVRGTSLAMSAAALSHEFNTALRNITLPLGGSTALTSVAAQDGDRIVIEVGARQHATAAGNVSISAGDDSGTDLPENETTTTANNPWVEFSQTLTFKSPDVLVSQIAAEVAGVGSPPVNVTQAAVEVATALTAPPVRVTQVAVETIQSTHFISMSAASAGSSAVDADLTLPPSLAATIAGSSSVTADLTVSGGGQERSWGQWID